MPLFLLDINEGLICQIFKSFPTKVKFIRAPKRIDAGAFGYYITSGR
jgi:hypothetical protein